MPVCAPPAGTRAPAAPHPARSEARVLGCHPPPRGAVGLAAALICSSLATQDVGRHSSGSVATCMFPGLRCLFRSSVSFLIRLFTYGVLSALFIYESFLSLPPAPPTAAPDVLESPGWGSLHTPCVPAQLLYFPIVYFRQDKEQVNTRCPQEAHLNQKDTQRLAAQSCFMQSRVVEETEGLHVLLTRDERDTHNEKQAVLSGQKPSRTHML